MADRNARKDYLVFTIKGRIVIDTLNPDSFAAAAKAVNDAVASFDAVGGDGVTASSKLDRS